MSIGDIVNSYGRKQSPYMNGLVNHLPMGQLAIYRMTGSLDKVEEYSEVFNSMYSIDKVRADYPKAETLEECVGRPELYESALELIGKEKKSRTELAKEVLNSYSRGVSSGLFHALIRTAYAYEGMDIDETMEEEMDRAIAYYVTAYKKAGKFGRKVEGEDALKEMMELHSDDVTRKAVSGKSSLGQRMKFLYNDEQFMEKGFIVEGEAKEKVEAMLQIAVSAYMGSGSIVALHCITGLHAMTVLEELYDDYSEVLDVMMTCIAVHIIAGDLDMEDGDYGNVEESWEDILEKASAQKDVHAVKLAYSASELSKEYDVTGLKQAALKRIGE